MGHDEIHRPPLELAAERAPQGNECHEPVVRSSPKSRQLGQDRSVEARNERDDTIVVAETVELACELECDDLGAASLGASDEMQDAQPRHAAMTADAGPGKGRYAVREGRADRAERAPGLGSIFASRAQVRTLGTSGLGTPCPEHVDGALWQPHIEKQRCTSRP